ncbi:hypothetical protein A4X06_0g6431 [Tilletia controversa]|uniref:Rad4-domain-containing protein n=1 Tax=Tilletia controversa TaxID=13291 RepID=A0A8X7MNT5_9BASI|nr:hypothetical protein CF328_g5581 [Tilletia controversa]KAE8243277.1 hypothetical protein A4X06_0g6431 [Tilletia controversa]
MDREDEADELGLEPELELEDIDVDADDSSDLAEAYAAAYDEANATGTGDDDGDGPSGASQPSVYYDGKGQARGVEVSLQAVKTKIEEKKKRRPVNFLTPQDRRNRLTAHMLHVLCLIEWARHRNVLLNNDGLQDHLANMTPPALISKMRAIHPKKITEQRERVRLFESFVTELVEWWKSRFRVDDDLTARAGLRQPTSATELLVPANARQLPSGKVIDGWAVESPQERENRHKEEKSKRKKTVTAEIALFPPGQESARNTTLLTYFRLLPPAEAISSVDDLIRITSLRFGSRETSAQLFCSLCRAIGVPARLVVSLQVPPYSVGAGKLASIATEADKMGRGRASGSSQNAGPSRLPARQPTMSAVEPINQSSPPTVWVEVFSKPYQRWLTVDPVRGSLQATGHRYMEPAPHDKNNKLVYVVAVEEDNYCRDVTPRYTRALRSRVARLRPPAALTGGKDWWDRVVAAIHRPQRLDRDAMEDAEMDQSLQREPMPKSMATFKNHPVYALESQLKRNEAVFPRNRVGTFQGQDVFLRQDVVEVHSVRQWYLNYGRVLSRPADGSESVEEPLKWAKTRGYTIANKRAEEQARSEGRDVLQEGLYAEFQTEVHTAPPVREDGSIPTNQFGNVDLYVPSMLPPGGAHIPFAGAAKVAKQLHMPYAEAVTGFEFRKGRSNPKLEGIVVAQFNAQTLLDAFWESERHRAQQERAKTRERAVRNWRRAYKAVLISLRIKRQYGPGSSAAADAAFRKAMGRDEEGAAAAKKRREAKGKGKEVRQLRALDDDDDEEDTDDDGHFPTSTAGSTIAGQSDAGGFIRDGDDDGDDSFAPGGFFVGDDFDQEQEHEQDGYEDDSSRRSFDPRSETGPSPRADGVSRNSAGGAGAGTGKRKIVSLYDLASNENGGYVSGASSSQSRPESAKKQRQTRAPRKTQTKQTEAETGTKTRKGKGKSKVAAEPKPKPTATTPLRRSTRASARTGTARQRDLERAQLDALRDVLGDEELAREEDELAAAAAVDTSSDSDGE